MDSLSSPINNPNDWSQVFTVDTTLRELGAAGIKGYQPFRPSVLMTSPLLAVMVASNTPEHYRRGGWLRQQLEVNIPGLRWGEIQSLFLPVNQLSLHRMVGVSTGYSVELFIPRYFYQVSIGVWEFTGDLRDEGLTELLWELDQIRANLGAVSNTVDALFASTEPRT